MTGDRIVWVPTPPEPEIVRVPDPAIAVRVPEPGPIEIVRIETPGVPGPPGQQGVAGPNAGFEHVQSAAAATWIIAHTLGRRPVVAVFDGAGNEILTDIAAGPSVVTVMFAQATSGFATIA